MPEIKFDRQMNGYNMFFDQTPTTSKHALKNLQRMEDRCCMQNNHLPTKCPIELKGNSH